MEIELTELTKTVRKVNVEFPLFVKIEDSIYRIEHLNRYASVTINNNKSASIGTWNISATQYIQDGEKVNESDFLTALSAAKEIIHADFISTMEERNA